MSPSRSRRIGAGLWLLLITSILVELPVGLAWDPAYNPLELTISDLGATTCTTIDYRPVRCRCARPGMRP